jgi:phosphatidate cytidylyltransferase
VTGFIIGGIAVVGDLSESMFKRDSGVKDSSALLPGHGGMLDKLDGIIFSSPVVYIMVKYLTE